MPRRRCRGDASACAGSALAALIFIVTERFRGAPNAARSGGAWAPKSVVVQKSASTAALGVPPPSRSSSGSLRTFASERSLAAGHFGQPPLPAARDQRRALGRPRRGRCPAALPASWLSFDVPLLCPGTASVRAGGLPPDSRGAHRAPVPRRLHRPGRWPPAPERGNPAGALLDGRERGRAPRGRRGQEQVRDRAAPGGALPPARHSSARATTARATPATIPGDSWAILTTRPGAGWSIFTATEGDFALSPALRPPAHHEPEHARQAAPRAGAAEPPDPLRGRGGCIRSRARCPDREAGEAQVRQGHAPAPGRAPEH